MAALYAILTLGLAACGLTGPGGGAARSDSLVVRSGTSFGECLGYCTTELEIDGGRAALVQRGSSGQMFPDRMLERDVPDSIRIAVATELDLARFFGLDEVYGCPDCADGGAEWIEVEDGERRKRVTFEFGHPPEALAGLADVLGAYRESLVKQFDTAR